MTLNAEGALLACASTAGTVIKIFSSEEGVPLQELRRGSAKALITNIVFHPTQNLIACCSNKTSIHLFEIKKSSDSGDGKASPSGGSGVGTNLEQTENKKSM